MTSKFKTDQEFFWNGEFGDEYVERNQGEKFLKIAENQLRTSLHRAGKISSAIELGSNVGNNIQALSSLYKGIDLHAIEINKKAAETLRTKNICKVHNTSIYEANIDRTFDLSFTSGVLIHLAPERLNEAYDKLYDFSEKYILISEYYNHQPQEIPYRGHSEKLYRRDFAGEFLDRHKDTTLIDYGFLYHRDTSIALNEDIYWFLIKKENSNDE